MNLSRFKDCWFALQVKQNYEQLAATVLRSKGYEEFLPLVRPKAIQPQRVTRFGERALYPGYIFCKFDPNAGAPIVTTPGVIRIVGNGVTPISIAEWEIAKIKLIIQSKLPAYPWPYASVGERVRVTEGPLIGVEGIITKVKNIHRLIISIDFLQQSAAVEIASSWVRSLAA